MDTERFVLFSRNMNFRANTYFVTFKVSNICYKEDIYGHYLPFSKERKRRTTKIQLSWENKMIPFVFTEYNSIQRHRSFNFRYCLSQQISCWMQQRFFSTLVRLSPWERKCAIYSVCLFSQFAYLFLFVTRLFPSHLYDRNPLHLAIAFVIELIYILHSGWFTTGFQLYVHRLYSWFYSGFAYHRATYFLFVFVRVYTFRDIFYSIAIPPACHIDNTHIHTLRHATCLFPRLSWLWLFLSWSYIYLCR